ncbi:MAG: hypothetical protein BroJett040_19210 [Oligoflexia bacterium]|nr:MAG: hypothetical protein BroJett040_19210 [Oligoflexia bacterium]
MLRSSDFDELPKYTVYRDRFRQIAVANKFDILSQPVSGQGPFLRELKSDLTIDFAFINQNAPVTLVHLSGVHGVEGYLGSDIQNEIMSKIPLRNLSCNFVFVHAVNPYGMSWYRRANAQNVDLNRNGRENFHPVESEKDFQRFQDFLSSKNGLSFYAHLGRAIIVAAQIGRRNTAQAIACGQYSYPDSLFYGGDRTQFEVEVLIDTLFGIAPETHEWIFLDVHSGLGKWKQELLILDGLSTPKEYEFFYDAHKAPLIVPGKTKDVYLAHGMLSNIIKKRLSNVCYLTQEFGTDHFLKIIRNLILENSHWHQKRNQLSVPIAQNMVNSFYPSDQAWRKSCLSLGRQRYHEILHRLRLI